MLEAAQIQCFNLNFDQNSLIENENKTSEKFRENYWRNCETFKKAKKSQKIFSWLNRLLKCPLHALWPNFT